MNVKLKLTSRTNEAIRFIPVNLKNRAESSREHDIILTTEH